MVKYYLLLFPSLPARLFYDNINESNEKRDNRNLIDNIRTIRKVRLIISLNCLNWRALVQE